MTQKSGKATSALASRCTENISNDKSDVNDDLHPRLLKYLYISPSSVSVELNLKFDAQEAVEALLEEQTEQVVHG